MAVYFARFPTWSVKIGHSDNVDARLAQLGRHYGVPLVLLHTEPGSRPEEDSWHERFAHLRLGRTEQFRPGSDLMRTLGLLLPDGVDPDSVKAVDPVVLPLSFDTVEIRISKAAAAAAMMAAIGQGMSLADYATDVLAKAAERDIAREARKLAKGADEGD